MNTKATKTSVSTKTVKVAHKQSKPVDSVSPEYVVRRLNEDVRNSILVVSVLVNLFLLIGWLVIEVSNRYDAALIYYLQNK